MNQQLLNDLPFKTAQQAQDFKPHQHNTRPSLHQHQLCNLSAALTIIDSQQIMYVFLFLTFDRHVAYTCGVYRRTEWRQLGWRDGMWGETSFITQCFHIPWYGWVRISQAAAHTTLTPHLPKVRFLCDGCIIYWARKACGKTKTSDLCVYLPFNLKGWLDFNQVKQLTKGGNSQSSELSFNCFRCLNNLPPKMEPQAVCGKWNYLWRHTALDEKTFYKGCFFAVQT